MKYFSEKIIFFWFYFLAKNRLFEGNFIARVGGNSSFRVKRVDGMGGGPGCWDGTL
jgi:hypothetical protein